MSDRTLEQRRAAFALKQLMKHAENGDYGNYAGRIKNFPASVLSNGLGQALATLLAKSKNDNGCKLLYADLQAWMCDENDISSPYHGAQHLLEALTNNSQDQYVMAQVELLALAVWMKKFAQAYLDKKEE